MREILFRGKTKESGEWVQGYFVYAKSDFDSEECREADIIPHDTDRVYKGEYNIVFPCIPKTIGQFTGLLDKNSNKIFEGDIVKDIVGRMKAVEFYNGRYYPFISFPEYTCWNTDEVEVIGNIYDNPELLRTPQNDEVI